MAHSNKRSKRLAQKLIGFLSSNTFFYCVIGLFVLQAGWIALSARYPQAFDEQFHLGIIQLYSHQLSPFFAHQPPGTATFGALTRDPSYLYHYLMSFPYRWIGHFTQDLTIQVIIMRLINIAFMVGGLVIFRKVLRFTKASPALIHVSLFFFVATPVVPLLASQINYDNLTIPLTGLAILLYLRFMQQLREQNAWRWDTLGWLAIVCMITSLVKYTFLPVFFALALLTFFSWWRRRRATPALPATSYALPKPALGWCIGILTLLSAGLFAQTYAINIVQYHSFSPQCDQVLTVARCQTYAPWARNYMYEQQHVQLSKAEVLTYPAIWIYHSIGELTFTISSAFDDSGDGTVDYYVGTQLVIIEVVSWTIFAVALVMLVYYAKSIWRNPVLRAFTVVGGIYGAALFAQNYQDYLHLGYPVAIHGRYLLPILPLIYVMTAIGVRKTLARRWIPKPRALNYKAALAGGFILVMLFEGGGFVTYIIRSDPSWFWPQSTPVQKVNDKARSILKPLVIGNKKQGRL
jgi:hypothetical protein